MLDDFDPLEPWTARTKVQRTDLPSLRRIPDPDQRLYLRFYLRSHMDRDQEIARARCATFGIDYETARAEARRS